MAEWRVSNEGGTEADIHRRQTSGSCRPFADSREGEKGKEKKGRRQGRPSGHPTAACFERRPRQLRTRGPIVSAALFPFYFNRILLRSNGL
jgi:hypothetical protein